MGSVKDGQFKSTRVRRFSEPGMSESHNHAMKLKFILLTRDAEPSCVLSKESNPVAGLISPRRGRPIHLDATGVRPEAEKVCLDDRVDGEEHVKVGERLPHSCATLFADGR